ncbi:MAG: hypothetical protein IJF87_00975 [Erysipelotrichaceae bacterium]|nr:hypothetical protein [Erysipelotrichaceae bacterium]
MNNKKEKRITTSFLKAMKLMITSFMMYAFPSMMLNIISTIAGHAIPIKDCYNYVAVTEFAIGILAARLYAIFYAVTFFVIAMKERFGIWIRVNKDWISIKSPITISKVKV